MHKNFLEIILWIFGILREKNRFDESALNGETVKTKKNILCMDKLNGKLPIILTHIEFK